MRQTTSRLWRGSFGQTRHDAKTRFFRFPGFADTQSLNAWLKQRNVGIFGADLWASDWLTMTPEAELKLVLERLEKARRGILLLHDTRRSTALMLPKLLVDLKKRGFHVVQLVPGDGSPPKFREAPKGWHSETEAILAKVLSPTRSATAEKAKSSAPKRPQPTLESPEPSATHS